MKQTIAYYDQNAGTFIDRTLNRDLTAQYKRFLAHMPEGGHILDLGCGSGRDLKYFAEQGYDAMGIDASTAMVEFAAQYSGRPVEHLRFDELTGTAEFDGIWACASLLHVPRAKLPTILDLLAMALRPHGVLYISLKEGDHECEKDGRFFTFWSEDQLKTLFNAHPSFTLFDMWNTSPFTGSEAAWLSVLAKPTSRK